MRSETNTDEAINEGTEKIIFKSAIGAIVVGVIVAAYFIWLSSQETYSAVYIYPESYTNYVNPGNIISFRYGIACYEAKETRYEIRIYLGDELVRTKEITLKKGEVWEDNESIILPENITLPTKVRIVVRTDNTVYEVYFWIKEKLK